MHTIKILLTYYMNISVQAANLSDCRIESNRKNRFGRENRIESKLFFCPNWNALAHTPSWACAHLTLWATHYYAKNIYVVYTNYVIRVCITSQSFEF